MRAKWKGRRIKCLHCSEIAICKHLCRRHYSKLYVSLKREGQRQIDLTPEEENMLRDGLETLSEAETRQETIRWMR